MKKSILVATVMAIMMATTANATPRPNVSVAREGTVIAVTENKVGTAHQNTGRADKNLSLWRAQREAEKPVRVPLEEVPNYVVAGIDNVISVTKTKNSWVVESTKEVFLIEEQIKEDKTIYTIVPFPIA